MGSPRRTPFEWPRGRLVYVADTQAGLRRRRSGDGFAYVDARGRRVTDERTLARIRALAIPPAYRDVWICRDPRGHLQATARDARGRKQYRYHPRWRAQRDSVKFQRTIEFATRLPALRRRVARDLRANGLVRERVLAAIVRLLDRTRMRIGNEEYAKANGSFGVSTLRNRHVRVRGDRVRLAFRGKSGQHHERLLQDPRLARTIRRCQDLPGQYLFQYVDGGRRHRVSSGDVNAYLRAVMGDDYTAKDFRTWAASVIVADALFGSGDAPASLQAAIALAAGELGNTPTVCRTTYVHPAVLIAVDDDDRWSRALGAFRRIRRADRGLSRAERALLRYLRREPRS
ncbi:DNA topoisomerase IB [Dokdonella sp.]|uniref:DNA topoisomerase IB n=1 Tax=Dokdonella sp. TaxID=2291710 RepID=UPI002F3F4750